MRKLLDNEGKLETIDFGRKIGCAYRKITLFFLILIHNPIIIIYDSMTSYDLFDFCCWVQDASLNVAASTRRVDSETVISSNVVHSYWCW